MNAEQYLEKIRELINQRELKSAVLAAIEFKKSYREESAETILISDEKDDHILLEVLFCAENELTYSDNKSHVLGYFDTWCGLDPEEANRIFWEVIIPDYKYDEYVVFLLEHYFNKLVFYYRTKDHAKFLELVEQTWRALDMYGNQNLGQDSSAREKIISLLITDKQYATAKTKLEKTRAKLQNGWFIYLNLAMHDNDITFIRSTIQKLREFKAQVTDEAYIDNYTDSIIEFFADAAESITSRFKMYPDCEPAGLILQNLKNAINKHDISREFVEKTIADLQRFEDSIGGLCNKDIYYRARDMVIDYDRLIRPCYTPEELDSVINDLSERANTLELEKFLTDNKIKFEQQLQTLTPHDLRSILSDSAMSFVKSDPDVLNMLISGETLWNQVKDRLNQYSEYTFVVCNYLKAVEVLLKGYLANHCEGCEIKTSGQMIVRIGSTEFEKITLGNISHFIKNNPAKILQNPGKGKEIFCLLKDWIDNVRNAHFHSHLIESPDVARDIREKTLQLLNRLCGEFKKI